MKIQFEPALSGCLASSQPLYDSPGDLAAKDTLPSARVKGACRVRDIYVTDGRGMAADAPAAEVRLPAGPGSGVGFVAASAVRRSLGARHDVSHRPTALALFGHERVPSVAHVSAHPDLRDGPLLAVAQAVAAARPATLAAMLQRTPQGVRVRWFLEPGVAKHCLLSAQVLHTRDNKPLGSIAAAAATAAWPLFLEKAFAATNNGYASLCAPMRAADICTWLTGAPARHVAPILPGWVDDIAALFEAGECVVLHRDDGDCAVVGVTRVAGACSLTLANPKGGTGVFRAPATFSVTDKKPAGKWRGYTRSYLNDAQVSR